MDFKEKEDEKINLRTTAGGPENAFAGKYTVCETLGTGGMSTVYRGEDPVLARSVAIKMMHPFLSDNEVMIKRFRQEGRAISQLNHPHIVRVYEFGISEQGQQPYIVMDCVQGESLQHMIKSAGPMHSDDALVLFRQIAAALAHAHAKGVLHRDLKPSNVMVDKDDHGKLNAVLVDFGIAKVSRGEQDAARLTATGEVFGSPLYMSPEQARGMEIDARSDLYSFGCLMFEALTGQAPCGGANSLEVLYNKMNADAPSMDKAAPHVPQHLRSVVDKLLQRDPEKRFQTAEDVIRALDNPLSAVTNNSKKTFFIGMFISLVCLFPIMVWVFAQTGPHTTRGTFATRSAVHTREMSLRSQHVTDSQLAALDLPKDVLTLDLADSQITDKSAPVIANLNQLESLGLDNSKISDEFISSVPISVGWLSLNGTNLTNKGIRKLTRLQNLHGVTLDGFPADAETFSNLSQLPQLRELYLRGPSVNDELMHDIGKLKNLQQLSITAGGVSDKGLADLSALTELRSLDLSDNPISAEGLKLLAPLRHLQKLKINGVKLTSDQLQAVRAALPPGCEI
jgi:serine/threonine protein kinase